MRSTMIATACIVLGFMGWGIYNLVVEQKTLTTEIVKLREMNTRITDENASLLSQIEYYKHPENLVKQLKSQFNYHAPDEKLLIVVPRNTTMPTSTP